MALTAGICGLGVGEQHILGYNKAGVKVSHVYDTDELKAHRIANKYGCKVAKSFDDLLNCEFVSIATPDDTHAPLVIKALKQDCKVMCEKPLCTDLRELDVIRGGKVAMNLPLRFHEPYSDWINQGWNIRRFEGLYYYGRRHKLNGWRGNPGYSAVLGGMIHIYDALALIIGEIPACLTKISNDGAVIVLAATSNSAIGTITVDMYGKTDHHHRIAVDHDEHSVHVNRLPTDKSISITRFALNPDEYASDYDFCLMDELLRIEEMK